MTTVNRRRWLLRRTDWVTPGAGGAVMALGIVSLDFRLIHRPWLARGAFLVAALVWLVLAGTFVVRLAADRQRWRAEAMTAGALTAVAATAVLGTELSELGWDWAAIVALAIAMGGWLVLVPPLIRRRRQRSVGADLLLCVATQGVAVLCAVLAAAHGWTALLPVALTALALGLLLYLAVLTRFDWKQLVSGAGDHWIIAGGLAISSLAATQLERAERTLRREPVSSDVLLHAAMGLLAIAFGAAVALAACEILRPRWAFDVRRWATAFPIGMLGSASLAASADTGIGSLHSIGVGLSWLAAAVCAALGLAAIRRMVNS